MQERHSVRRIPYLDYQQIHLERPCVRPVFVSFCWLWLAHSQDIYDAIDRNFRSMIVVGGGIAGAATLYNLSRKTNVPLYLFDKYKLMSGTTWHSAGLVCRTPSQPSLLEYFLLNKTMDDCQSLSVPLAHPGRLYFGDSPMWDKHLTQIHTLVTQQPNRPNVTVLGPTEVSRQFPSLNTSDINCALFSQQCAGVEPMDLTTAYFRAAKQQPHVNIIEDKAVVHVHTKGASVSGVTLSDDTFLPATTVVLALGANTVPLLKNSFGLHIPMISFEHSYAITAPNPQLFSQLCHLRDLGAGLVIRRIGDSVMFGGYEETPVPWNPNVATVPHILTEFNWELFEPIWQAAIHRVPGLHNVGIKSTVNGPELFTVDGKPLVGPVPGIDGLWLSTGFNSGGIQLAGGCAALLTDCIVDNSENIGTVTQTVSKEQQRQLSVDFEKWFSPARFDMSVQLDTSTLISRCAKQLTAHFHPK